MMVMKTILNLVSLGVFLTSVVHANADCFLVEDGQPRAEIIIAEKPPRTARLAAQELQIYVEKISGVKLSIVTQPSGKVPVRVFVGRSSHTDKLGITDEGLRYGAYRIVSGDDWLALIGDDTDFTPVEPWARSHSHWQNEKVHEWDRLTGAKWSNPFAAGMYRNYSGNAHQFDPANSVSGDEIHFWRFDRRGPLNAVYAWLRELGVRWYMPGELGEIVPREKSISLLEIDRTVHPDFDIRSLTVVRYHSRSREDIHWSLRLGTNRVPSLMHHGLRYLTEREDQHAAHPEYFSLINGVRDNRSKTANACLSSEGLFEENVRFVRTMFDHYDVPIVSVMPHDGFTHICECDKCRGKATLDRGYSGWYSDYVWEYVNRVAREVAKTHPGRKIMCGAYSTYQLPPQNIDRLEPNVLVQITNGRPRWEMDDATHGQLDELRRAWMVKTPNKLSLTMNYPFTQRGEFRPCYFPHVIVRGVRDTKDQVWRQENWVPERKGRLHEPGVNHLNAWVLARFMWDSGQDIDALLDEYYGLFYGPAAEPMKAFIEYCELNYADLSKEKEIVSRALDLFATAKAEVSPDSVYGQRLALVDDYLEELRRRRDQLNQPRDNVPEFWTYNYDNSKWDETKQTFKLDGKLDEKFWVLRGQLRDLVTGEKPEHKSRFQVLTSRDAIYLGIRCEDVASNPANIATTQSGKPAIWNGDHVEILLETDSHSYYQIVVNPAGAILDLDRAAPKSQWFSWTSKTEVGAHVGEDFWSVELRIPVTEDTDDPLHLVIGREPREDLPWYFNICRKRIRGDDVQTSAFSPTGENNFHVTRKLGKLFQR